MKRLDKVLIILSAVILLSIATVGATSAVKPHQNTVEPAVTVQSLDADKIFNLVNQERINAGLKPLIRDGRLNQSAQMKADDMVNDNYFAHVNPATGVSGYTLIPNGMCSYKSENIGMTNGFTNDNTEQLDWWMHSKPHHDAILDSRYTLTGVAVNGNKVVQHFCIAK